MASAPYRNIGILLAILIVIGTSFCIGKPHAIQIATNLNYQMILGPIDPCKFIVSKCNYTIVRPKTSWAGLIRRTHQYHYSGTASDCQTPRKAVRLEGNKQLTIIS